MWLVVRRLKPENRVNLAVVYVKGAEVFIRTERKMKI